MNFSIDDFVTDLGTLTDREIFIKYRGKVPDEVKPAGVVAKLSQRGLLPNLIRNDWGGPHGHFYEGLYLIWDGEFFESFRSERGGKFSLHRSRDLVTAVSEYLSLLLPELRITGAYV